MYLSLFIINTSTFLKATQKASRKDILSPVETLRLDHRELRSSKKRFIRMGGRMVGGMEGIALFCFVVVRLKGRPEPVT